MSIPYPIEIVADFREKASGIPEILSKKKIMFSLTALKAGDYLLNRNVLVERKTKDDFVLSLIQNRLFDQCLKLKNHSCSHFFIVEGNPYTTSHKIRNSAIKGALLSMAVSWQIPIMFSKNCEETAELLMMASLQMLHGNNKSIRTGIKPKRLKSKQLSFLQALPQIGIGLSVSMLSHFGSLKKAINASEEELMQIRGIGKRKAKIVRQFIDYQANFSTHEKHPTFSGRYYEFES